MADPEPTDSPKAEPSTANATAEPDSAAEPTSTAEPDSKAEPDPPLNRAARRALRRGKKPTSRSLPGPGVTVPGPRDQVVGIRRRAGRRGNR